MKNFEGNMFIFIAMIFVSSLIFSGCNKEVGDNLKKSYDMLNYPEIEFIREGAFNLNPNVKVGSAFDQLFTNGHWSSFKTANNDQVVEFTGYFSLKDKPEMLVLLSDLYNVSTLVRISKEPTKEQAAKMLIQFVINGQNFNIQHMEINGIVMNDLAITSIVNTIISSYRLTPSR